MQTEVSELHFEKPKNSQEETELADLASELQKDQEKNGPMKTIARGVLEILRSASFQKKMKEVVLSGTEGSFKPSQPTITFHFGRNEYKMYSKIQLEQKNERQFEFNVQFCIDLLNEIVTPNTREKEYSDYMGSSVCVVNFDGVCSEDALLFRRWSATHQDYEQLGFAKSLVLMSHVIHRTILNYLPADVPIFEMRAETTDRSETGWTSKMAARLGYTREYPRKNFFYNYDL